LFDHGGSKNRYFAIVGLAIGLDSLAPEQQARLVTRVVIPDSKYSSIAIGALRNIKDPKQFCRLIGAAIMPQEADDPKFYSDQASAVRQLAERKILWP